MTFGNLDAVNSRASTRHPGRNCLTSKQRLRVRRPQLNIISAQSHQAVSLSSGFELGPPRMNLFNLLDGVFRECAHSWVWLADVLIVLQDHMFRFGLLLIN